MRDWTTFWVGAFFALALGYGFLPDQVKADWYYDLVQWHAVFLAAAGYSAISFRTTIAKGAMALALAYCLGVALVDRWLPHVPMAGYVGAAAFFLGWLLYFRWRARALQGGEETGRDKQSVYDDDPWQGRG